MKSIVNETVLETHKAYSEFEREQYIVDLDVGDKVRIQVFNDKNEVLSEKLFVAKYVNCHVNCQWQDKGVKNIEDK